MRKRKFFLLLALLSASQGAEASFCPEWFSAFTDPPANAIGLPLEASNALPAKAGKGAGFYLKYWWRKLSDVKNADANYIAQMKFRAALTRAPKQTELKLLPVDDIELLHDVSGWKEAEEKLAERVGRLRAYMAQHPSARNFSLATLDEVLPSKNPIRVLALEDGHHVVFDGNGRFEALRAIPRKLRVEVEVTRAEDPQLTRMVREIQAMSDNPEIRRAGERALDPSATPVLMKYSPAIAVDLQAPGRAYWKRALGTDLGDSGLVVAHASPTEAVIDWLLTVSRPGDAIDISQAPKLEGAVRELGRRPVTTSDAGAKGIVATIFNVEEAGAAVAAGISRLPTGQPVLALRAHGARAPPTSLLSAHPNLTEVVSFGGGRGAPAYVLTAGSNDLLQPVLRTLESRGQWLGRIVQGEIAADLSAKAEAAVPRGMVTYDPQALRYTALPEDAPHQVFSDLMKLYENEDQIPSRMKYQLGQGQPAIEMDRARLGKIVAANQGADEAVAGAKLDKSMRSWYREKYGVNLPAGSVVPSQAVSGALFDIFSSIPPQSTIFVPEMAYPYAPIAKIFGHELKPVPAGTPFSQLPRTGREAAVLVNFPHNPTGQLITAADRAFLRDANEAGLLVVNDLTFVKNAYDGKKVESMLKGLPDTKGYLELFSTSKDIGLLEYRVGAVVGDPAWVARIKERRIASWRNVPPERFGIMADVLDQASRVILTNAPEMQARRDEVVSIFRAMGWPAEQIVVPEAGLNLIVKVPPSVDPARLTKALFDRFHLTVLPDIYFTGSADGERFVRISMSEPVERLRELREAVEKSPYRYQNLGEWAE